MEKHTRQNRQSRNKIGNIGDTESLQNFKATTTDFYVVLKKATKGCFIYDALEALGIEKKKCECRKRYLDTKKIIAFFLKLF